MIKVDWLKMEEVENRTYKYGDIGKPHEFAIVSNNIILGYYKTKERALEVLDEIQRILKPAPFISPPLKSSDLLILNETVNFQELSTYVYEMPEE